MKNLSKHMSLFFWAGTSNFQVATLNKALDTSKYYMVRRLPLAEMLGSTPVEIAEELIGITTGAEWRSQHRRPVMCGDFFCQGVHPWVYVRMREFMACPELSDMPVLPLQAWPNYAIVNLLPDSVRTIVCRQ